MGQPKSFTQPPQIKTSKAFLTPSRQGRKELRENGASAGGRINHLLYFFPIFASWPAAKKT